MNLKSFKNIFPAVIGALVLVALAIGVSFVYRRSELERVDLFAELKSERELNLELLQTIRDRETVINSFEGQITSIGSTVGTLEKLSHTDQELLKKYSKVYFLNENYVPATLTDIDPQYVYKGSANFLIHAKVWPYLRELFEASHRDGIDLLSASSYRSFGTQAALKSSYSVSYGSGANAFSADQGYSEHQLGTALDLTTGKLGANFVNFATDPAYEWLLNNAYRYGFILSYPKNNSYYKFEPWHWRFVGVSLATMLHKEGKNFYDLDQREIDAYLVKVFD